MRFTFTLLSLLFILLGTTESQASHILGAEISYYCVNSCTVRVQQRAYRSCGGSSVISPNPFQFVSQSPGCTQPPPLNSWSATQVVELVPLCPAYATSQCTDPNAAFIGVQEYLWWRDYEICSVPNCIFILEWSTCCRTPNLSSLSSSSSTAIYLTSTTLNTNIPCNSSPEFDVPPPPFICAGQTSVVDFSATDPDGDSLVYALGPCFASPNTLVTYGPGYSATQFMGPTWNVTIQPDSGFITFTATPGTIVEGVICVYVEEWRNGQLIGTTSRDYTLPVLNCPNAICGDNLVTGTIFKEDNSNCIQDPNEPGLPNHLVMVLPDSVVVPTDSAGFYQFTPKAGTYTVIPLPLSSVWNVVCPTPPSHTVVVTGTNTTTNGLDFGKDALFDCPVMYVDIGSGIVRPCFQNEFVVSYANAGTDTAFNAYIEVNLDTNYVIDSTTHPYTGSGPVYTFPLGDLGIGQGGQFRIYATLACDTNLVSYVMCTEAHAYPDSSCLPPNPLWDHSSLSVTGTCVNDSACFNIRNNGPAGTSNMAGPTDWRFLTNTNQTATGTLQLCGGCDTTLYFPGAAQTYRMEVDQRPGHPGDSRPNATVQFCGPGTPFLNFTTALPEDDADPFVSIDCKEVVNSFDPNMKYVTPLGVDTAFRYIDSTDVLEYMIDFQNTGTANAIQVVLRDTLSSKLDLSTISMGVSSHPYWWRINPERELEISFDNIQLVPESVDSLQSIGWVKFKIALKKGLQTGDRIENFADIYFDFNSPIRTNTVWNTIGWPVVISQERGKSPLDVVVYPNPTTGRLKARVDNLPQGTPLHLEVYSLVGQRVSAIDFEAGTTYEWSLTGVPKGIYIFRISNGNQLLKTGKIILE